MRAIAILWVFALHCVVLSPHWADCFGLNDYNKWILAWPRAGDLGVDMFFVLSGFLIAYILMKEHKKYGSIDVVGFFRGRFIRIWFVLALFCPTQFIVEHTSTWYRTRNVTYGHSIQRLVSCLTFTVNIVQDYTHLWSVAVEFQMYALSPWIIESMLSSSPYRLPLILLFVTIFLKLLITFAVCPYMLTNDPDPSKNDCLTNPVWYFGNLYTQTYTRAGPYFLGMIAAYWHLNPSEKPVLRPICHTLLEYFCLIILFSIGLFGVKAGDVRITGINGEEWNRFVGWIYGSVARCAYGAAWLWLMPSFLSNETIPMYRPASWCRAFLGCGGWLPIATLSYSIYVWSVLFIITLNVYSGECDNIWGKFGWFSAKMFVASFLTAVGTFIFIERPCNNARTVFKSSHQMMAERMRA